MRSLSALLLLLAGCATETPQSTEPTANEATASTETAAPTGGPMIGEVLEQMDAGGYTYLQLKLPTETVWVAAPQMKLPLGAEVQVGPANLMQGFHSKTLGRSFDRIYFANSVSLVGDEPATASGLPAGHPAYNPDDLVKLPAAEHSDAPAEVVKGELAVATVYTDRQELGGKQITLRGEVVKVNTGIMGRNWVHLQDGSGEAEQGTHDLTITTQDLPQVGEQVVVQGVLGLEKDFGGGYHYPLILEQASFEAAQ